MKHHSGVTKTRSQPRSSRSSGDHLPSAASMTPLNIHATRSTTGFWNQYQVFLNAGDKPIDNPRSVGQEEIELAGSTRSQMDPGASECKEGETSKGS